MKRYQEPQMNIYDSENEDIITSSGRLYDSDNDSTGGDGVTSDGMGWDEF